MVGSTVSSRLDLTSIYLMESDPVYEWSRPGYALLHFSGYSGDVLDALQTDELCPCNWQKGDETLKAA